MPAFDFNNERRVNIPQSRKTPQSLIIDLKGLDLVTPVDLLMDGHTPFAKNFRLYAQQSDDRQVAVSSRKGPGHYIDPLNETKSVSNESTTGAGTVEVSGISSVILQPWVADNSDMLTSISVAPGNNATGSGPLLLEVYANDSGKPGRFLTSTSILNGSIGSTPSYKTAQLLKSVKLVSGDTYWLVAYIQDDGKGTYQLSTTTTGTKAWITNSSIASAVEQTFAINFRTYTTPQAAYKGSYRFARDNGNNITVVVYGTTMYRVDENTKALIPVISGLSADATEYSFTNGDNKLFWVNGKDAGIYTWDGTSVDTNPELNPNPSFATDMSGWSKDMPTGTDSQATMARNTSVFFSAPASGLFSTSGTTRRARILSVPMKKSMRYQITAQMRTASGTATVQLYDYTNSVNVGSTFAIDTNWAKQDLIYVPQADSSSIGWTNGSANFHMDDVSVKATGVEIITDPELPILSQILMHKDRIWGVTANDPNKLVFSENPGNPSDQPTNNQWYYNWLSVSFIYAPRPHNGSPVTKIVSFQDGLVVFTQDRKYIISGYDRGSFTMREATGNKGALSSKSVTSDENRIYFASHDGLYEYDGSEDRLLSKRVTPLFDGCPNKGGIAPVIWKGKVRFYMASRTSSVNDICLLYNKDLDEFEFDTNTYVDSAVYYGDADDEQELVEFSSLAPVAYLAEQNYNALGAPIDFEYRFSYNSMGSPAQRKRILKFFPLFQGVDSSFPINISMDKDFQDSPKIKEIGLIVNGNTWGNFNWGDGTLWGGATSFKMNKLRFSGYGYYWQLRVAREAVNNRVAFIGAQYSYKAKRI